MISACEDAITSGGFNQSRVGEVSPKMEKETRTSVCNPGRVFPHAAKRLKGKNRKAYNLFYLLPSLELAGFVSYSIDFLVPRCRIVMSSTPVGGREDVWGCSYAPSLRFSISFIQL